MARSIAQRTLRDFLQETEDAISSGHIDTALANCQTVLGSFPKSLEAQRLLGEVYLAQRRLEEALHAFDWVLTNDPENVLAYCNRAEVSVHMSDIDTALDCYQQAYELSRGNSRIRQEFTQLSAKTGQQGFVFSRAGLARLYMRGNLLSQAAQEWEAVLAAAPERLDARTGLLETYWQDGSFNRVEELAAQILQDVSDCVKALLLLAHVTAPKDMAQAQALLRQAEALDPDLVMAQELFADMLAYYPDDPFLKLLKKAPCVLNTSPAPDVSPQASSVLPAAAPAYNSQLSMPGSSPQWDNSQGGNKDAAAPSPFSNGELPQHGSAPWAMGRMTNPMIDGDASRGDRRQATASSLEPSDLSVQLSNDLTPLMGSWSMEEEPSSPTPYQESQAEPWKMLQSALQSSPSAPEESQAEPWEMLQSALQSSPSAPEESQAEPWEMLQGALHNMPASITNQGEPQQWEDQGAVSNMDGGEQSWKSQGGLDTTAEPGMNDSWASPANNSEAEKNDWTLAAEENNPPSWLSMLTQADRNQMTSGNAPLEHTSSAPVQPEEVPSPPQEPVAHQPVVSPLSPSPEEFQLASSNDDDDFAFSIGNGDEEAGFGPAWLKSLGAATFEENEDAHLEPSAPSVSPPSTEMGEQEQSAPYALQNPFEAEIQEQATAYDPWKASEPRAQSTAYEPWWTSVQESQEQPVIEPGQQVQLKPFETHETLDSQPQPEAVSSSSEMEEQNLLATLEELEQQLRAKGFVAMEPNSLSAIAQAEESKSGKAVTPLATQWTSEPVQETSQEQSPSALTELGMMFQSSTDEAKSPISSAPSNSGTADFPAEPLWLQTLRSAPASEPDEAFASPEFSTPIVSRSVPPIKASQNSSQTSQEHMEAMAEPIFESAPVSASVAANSRQPEALNGQNVAANPFLESELETTMKRPAVRLQSMFHAAAPPDIASIPGKVRTSERGEPPLSKVTETSSLNYEERLLKGYQHQLVGDYDEAMQDYRLVVRGDPKLLGEVISNLRALLKLAPKYSAGYRVLGDAYMRQGEYLQAMDAYNCALTMAKKARS